MSIYVDIYIARASQYHQKMVQGDAPSCKLVYKPH